MRLKIKNIMLVVYVSLNTSGKDVLAYSLEMDPDLNPDGL
jgi:hypothetical protein